MAQRLYRREPVALLALFDASPVWDRMGLPDEHDMPRILSRFAGEFASILGKIDFNMQACNFDQLAEAFQQDINPSQLRDFFDIFLANMRALRAYTPKRYPGRITLFRPDTGAVNGGDPTLGWEDLAEGDVHVHFVHGDHDSMLRGPHIESLARTFRACLRS
jgi:thioesterase domain-containing protein